MKKNTIDQFVEKLACAMESKTIDYKAFIDLQRECIQILEAFNNNWCTDLEGLRRLGYFRLEINNNSSLLNSIKLNIGAKRQ